VFPSILPESTNNIFILNKSTKKQHILPAFHTHEELREPQAKVRSQNMKKQTKSTDFFWFDRAKALFRKDQSPYS